MVLQAAVTLWRRPVRMSALLMSSYPRSSQTGRGHQCVFSTSTAPHQTSGRRRTHRERRFARNHPSAYAPEESRKVVSNDDQVSLGPTQPTPALQVNTSEREWRPRDFSSDEFFEWMTTYPTEAEIARRIESEGGEDEEDDEDGASVKHLVKRIIIPRARMPAYDRDAIGADLIKSRRQLLGARSTAQLKAAYERFYENEKASRCEVRGIVLLSIAVHKNRVIDQLGA
ncbi:unnamed protein product [Choristocarpus tenellus]